MKKNQTNAYTLVELMIAMSIVVLSGVGLYSLISGSMLLFAKNTAINLSHQEIRSGMTRLQQELRAAVSSPQLMDNEGAMVSGTGPAAGVSFRLFAAGPCSVQVPSETSVTSISENSKRIVIATGNNGPATDFRPQVGQRLHIQINPMVEKDIVAVTPMGSSEGKTLYELTLEDKLGSQVVLRDGPDNEALNVSCFFTTPVKYSIQFDADKKARHLVRTGLSPGGVLASGTISRNVVAASAKPFSVPIFNGSPNYGYISVDNLTAADPTYSNRKLRGTQMAASLVIPHFGQLTPGS